MAKIIFVDVDDTLIRSVGSKRIPMVRAIEQVKALHLAGNTLYLWSSGGANYARESAVELGIDLLFEAFLPKPNVYIDEQEVHEWRTCKHILPGQDF